MESSVSDEESSAHPSTSDPDKLFVQSAKELGNYVAGFEGVVGCLAMGRTDSYTQSLLLFQEQHEYVVDSAKQICQKIIDSEASESEDKALALQEVRQYLTRLQIAQCQAASYLGSLWYSMSDPDALKFRSRAHFLTFEQRRKESVRRLEETIEEVNKVMKDLASKVHKDHLRKNINYVMGTRPDKLFGAKDGNKPKFRTKTEEEIIPMLMPNQNYISASQYAQQRASQNYVPSYHILRSGHIQQVMLPLQSDPSQSTTSRQSFHVFPCSKEHTGACLAILAILCCVGLAGFVVWVLTNHTDNPKPE